MSETEAIQLVHKALDVGVTFFDTAPNYGHGSGETRLGKALQGVDRSKIVINTKFGHTDTGTTNFSSDYITQSLEGSLKRLQVDYVDTLIIHNPPSSYLDGNKNDHYAILERLVDEGKIRGYGASLDTSAEMNLLMDTTGASVIEAFFNILHQDTASAIRSAKKRELGIIVKVPPDSGWLSGKYNASSTFHDIRSRCSKADIETRARLVQRVKEILDTEENLAQKAIAFCLAIDGVSTVIPGNINEKQLLQNVASCEQSMPKDVVQKLEEFYQNEVKALHLPW